MLGQQEPETGFGEAVAGVGGLAEPLLSLLDAILVGQQEPETHFGVVVAGRGSYTPGPLGMLFVVLSIGHMPNHEGVIRVEVDQEPCPCRFGDRRCGRVCLYPVD